MNNFQLKTVNTKTEDNNKRVTEGDYDAVSIGSNAELRQYRNKFI